MKTIILRLKRLGRFIGNWIDFQRTWGDVGVTGYACIAALYQIGTKPLLEVMGKINADSKLDLSVAETSHVLTRMMALGFVEYTADGYRLTWAGFQRVKADILRGKVYGHE